MPGKIEPAQVDCNAADNGLLPEHARYEFNISVQNTNGGCHGSSVSWLYVERPKTTGGTTWGFFYVAGASCPFDAIEAKGPELGFTMVRHNASRSSLVFRNKGGPNKPDMYSRDSEFCSVMIMGCPLYGIEKPTSPMQTGNYVDNRGTGYQCLPVPKRAKSLLVKIDGRSDSACVSLDGSNCLELEPTCCKMWESIKAGPKMGPLTSDTPFISCASIPDHGGADHWCSQVLALFPGEHDFRANMTETRSDPMRKCCATTALMLSGTECLVGGSRCRTLDCARVLRLLQIQKRILAVSQNGIWESGLPDYVRRI
jgi:hypothetical protein